MAGMSIVENSDNASEEEHGKKNTWRAVRCICERMMGAMIPRSE